MADSALAARARLGVRGMRVLQSRSFGSDSSDSIDPGAGSIRDTGGAFGKREKAEEDRYFQEKTREQLAALKKRHKDEIGHHMEEIERLHKKQLKT